MFVNFSEEVKSLLKEAERERDKINHPYVGSEHLLLSILRNSSINYIFKKYNVNYSNFRNKLISIIGIGSKKNDFVLYTPLLKRMLEDIIIDSKEKKIFDNS